jgi:protein gp37
MSEHYWNQPLKWEREAAAQGRMMKVFSSSLADVFDAEAPVSERARLFRLIEKTPHLFWLLLTKRPHLIRKMLPDNWGPTGYANVALGTTIELPKYMHIRLGHLLAVPAPVHFVSAEPLLAGLNFVDDDIVPHLPRVLGLVPSENDPRIPVNYLTGSIGAPVEQLANKISWVIVGGESGSQEQARPFDLDWARSLRDQCKAHGTAFFMKQLGSNPVQSGRPVVVPGRKGDRLEDLPVDLQIRQFPAAFGPAWQRPPEVPKKPRRTAQEAELLRRGILKEGSE